MKRKKRARALVLPLIVGGLALGGLAGCGGSPTAPAASMGADVEARLAALVNQHRASVGCPSLAAHARVADVAREHSEDMARRGFFGHVNPDGETPFDRLREAGIAWDGGAAENIARGRSSAEEILRAWLASPDHRAAIETCAYTDAGVGAVDGHWTQLFLTRPSP